LTKIRSGSLMFVVCLIGVSQRNFEPLVCVCVCVCVWYDGLRTESFRPSYHTHTHAHTHTLTHTHTHTPLVQITLLNTD